jgi:hypothetical protein
MNTYTKYIENIYKPYTNYGEEGTLKRLKRQVRAKFVEAKG